MFPRPSVWGAPSPREISIPSIPSLGSYSSPGMIRGVAPGFGGWSFTTGIEEFQRLCEGEAGGCGLERFLGSMSLFLYFTVTANKLTTAQVPMVRERGLS